MKKKIFAIALAASIAVLAIAGTSMAYFTDTKQYTNVFTAGNVTISLTEAPTAKDAYRNVVTVAGERIACNDDAVYNPLFPKQTIAKDPTIKNVGTEEAYFGAIITITNKEGTTGNVGKVLYTGTDESGKKTDVKAFITDLPTSGATVTVKEIKNADEEVIGFKIYVVYTDKYAANDSAVVFKGMKIPATWNNDEMAELNGMQIDVKAYATQTAGMTEGSLKALQDAFPEFKTLG